MVEITSYAHGTPCWVDLATTDVARACEFYEGLFGWQFIDTGEEAGHYQMAMLKERPVAGVMAMTPEMAEQGAQPSWAVYLAAEDLDRAAKRIQELGGGILTGPMDVMDQGRVLMARDPSGAVFGLWQAGAHHGSGLANEPGTFIWNELMSRRLSAAWKFYEGLLGYGHEDMDIGMAEPYIMIKVADRPVGGLMAMPEEVPADVPSNWMTYFCVADTDQSAARTTELGGAIVVEPRDSPYGRWSTVHDGQGAVFNLMAAPPAE